ncbi:MAG: translation initiation factor IF-3 [Chloroflexi bacterium]|nr:translation initiation factor IF-3 [Chloroflexota bacterium]
MQRELRVNERIRAREVRLIGENGEHLGIVPLAQALGTARESGFDLVEVDPHSDPPVCRVLDYGKWKYQQAKKDRDTRKHQRASVVHEVRMRPRIGQHDMERKVRTAERLLAGGDKVKVSVMFRGREMSRPELGQVLLRKVQEGLQDIAVVEKVPNLEGRFLSMIFTPSNKKPSPKPEAGAPEPAEAEEEKAPVQAEEVQA